MMKNLLRILASSATFVAVMFVTSMTMAQSATAMSTDSPAIAFPQTENVSLTASSSVSLNVISSSLESYQANNPLLDHLGCSCATCTQGPQFESI